MFAPIALSAPWPSGKAEDCKSFIPGSNPGGASRKNEGLQTSSRDLLPVVANSQGDWFRDLIMDDVIALTRLATRLPTLYH